METKNETSDVSRAEEMKNQANEAFKGESFMEFWISRLSLCFNISGQILTSLVMSPPKHLVRLLNACCRVSTLLLLQIVWEDFMSEDVTFCGVFDGHGPFGHLVA
ncbi:unnamed protein product [Brassica oleracea]|uniref:PPM-type phosphatase domain-containing protein n=1 Tax=Brassica oleracea TaxID=3712 RepID=A0A3P6CFN4_BRAOL|nr:unnamed protein product [Brassica oleracea]